MQATPTERIRAQKWRLQMAHRVGMRMACPSGEAGGVTLDLGPLCVCVAWARGVRGLSVSWGSRSLVEIDL